MTDENASNFLVDSIQPKSDQLNYDDFASGPKTVRVVGAAKGTPEQPVILRVTDAKTGEKLRDYKPCKSVRRVLVQLWGTSGKAWMGKLATLHGDPSVMFGGKQVGGIRVSAVSGISAPVGVLLTTARSKRVEVIIKPISEAEYPTTNATVSA
jgi:hypothetical protein